MPFQISDHKGILGEFNSAGLPGKDAVPVVLSLADNFLQRPEAHRLYTESALHKPLSDATAAELVWATQTVAQIFEQEIIIELTPSAPRLFDETGRVAGSLKIRVDRALAYAVRDNTNTFNQLALLTTILHECSHLVSFATQQTTPTMHYASRFTIIDGEARGESGFSLEGLIFGGICTLLFPSKADSKHEKRWEKISGVALEVGPMITLEEYESSNGLNGRPRQALLGCEFRYLDFAMIKQVLKVLKTEPVLSFPLIDVHTLPQLESTPHANAYRCRALELCASHTHSLQSSSGRATSTFYAEERADDRRVGPDV